MKMSSDSELDEFYDAEDTTPNRSTTEASAGIDSTRQEKDLLLSNQFQDERRKSEDEDLCSRLETLTQKKLEHKERKSESERKANLENRRRKHEEMRRKLMDTEENSDYTSSDNTNSDINIYSDFEGSIDQWKEKPDLEDNTFENYSIVNMGKNSLNSQIDYISGSHLVKYDEMSVIHTSNPDTDKPSKHQHDFVANKMTNDSMDRKTMDIEDVVDNALYDSQLFDDQNEPDIVKSTKTRTPTNTLQILTPAAQSTAGPSSVQEQVTYTEPKAPPRKKKRPKVLVLENIDTRPVSECSSIPSLPSLDSNLDSPALSWTDFQSPGLPPEHQKVPKLQQDQLATDLEQCLDLRSVIRGKKHINAKDAEVNAINSGLDSSKETIEVSMGNKSNSGSLDSSLDGMLTKTTSFERDKKSSKGSSLESEGKKSKASSSESKSSSLEKQEHSRSRTTCSQGVSSKESVNRPQSTAGKPLSDEEILLSVMVKNLDTGETVPLKDADQKLPKCVDPLVLHIMERTNNYPDDSGSDGDDDSKSESGGKSLPDNGHRKKGSKLKKFFGKKMEKTVTKVKHVADQVMNNDDTSTVVEGEISDDGRKFKFKANHNKKGPWDFGQLKLVQDLSGEHTGAVWCMKFSHCGRLLATGGQDMALRIWVLKSAYNYFDDMRQKYNDIKVSPAPSEESLSSIPSSLPSTSDMSLDLGATADSEEIKRGPFKSKPFCKYRGHTADLLDISWSKNYFILTSSMDKTVRLWHISRRECLCTFQHMDLVTSSVFHPKDDRYFLSGSLDGKFRLWNIPDKKVTLWNEVDGGRLITTANFCHNGKFAVVGTYDGKCIFYSTEQLKYYTEIFVRSTRGKNSKGKKITAIESLPGEDKVLVTSNDSRVRLYDLRDLTLTCKYKGPTNTSSQIKSSFSSKGRYIVCGSEDHFVYLWRTQHEFYKFSSARRDRNDYYEAYKVHNAVVTVALFAPNPQHFLKTDDTCLPKSIDSLSASPRAESETEYVISADFMGCIKVIKAK